MLRRNSRNAWNRGEPGPGARWAAARGARSGRSEPGPENTTELYGSGFADREGRSGEGVCVSEQRTGGVG